jgi:hypothetical protein
VQKNSDYKTKRFAGDWLNAQLFNKIHSHANFIPAWNLWTQISSINLKYKDDY